MNKVLLFGLLLATQLLLAQPKATTSGTAVKGLPVASAQKSISAERSNRIDRLLQEYVEKGWIAGATAIVIKDGAIVYHKGFGFSDLRTKEKIRTDHIFRIASQTKAITSVGIMILFEEGKLLLDDPLSKYIPAFAKTQVLDQFNEKDSTYTTKPANKPITIRHLLTHTSGIGYPQIGSKTYQAIAMKAGLSAMLGLPNRILAEEVEKLATLPLEHQPGEKFLYGLNSDVLGRVIEVVSQLSLADFLRTRIFEPLGMKDTWFYLPPDKQHRLVAIHGADSLGRAVPMEPTLTLNGIEIDGDYPKRAGKLYAGGAGLASTAYDYALFMQMLLNNGILNGKRILSPNSVRLMTTNQIGHVQSGFNRFGLGFGIIDAGESLRVGLSEGSYEWGGAFSSTYWIDPEKKIAAQLFLNMWPNPHPEIHDKFKVLVYSAME